MSVLEAIYYTGFILGCLALFIFALGHLGLLATPFLAAGVLLALVALLLTVKKIRLRQPHDDTPLRFSTEEKWLLGAVGVVVLLVLPLALSPPSVRDELIQHLAVPKLYIEKGGIFEIPFMGFSYLPLNIDLLYLIPLAFGNDVIPRLMHLGFALLTGLLIYSYLFERAGRTYAMLGLLLYMSTPLVFNLSRMAYIDHGSAFYSTCALIAALKWKDDPEGKWLLFSAVSMGFALGAKYNTLLSLLLITAFIVFTSARRSRGSATALKDGAFYVFIALVILSPWLIRNYIWKGSPFFPLYESAVKASGKGEGFHITSELAPLAKRFLLYNENILDILLLPLRIFWEGMDNSIQRFDGVLNPLFLVFLPFAFFKRGSKDVRYLALFCVLFFYMAFFTVDLVTRYLLPALPALLILVTLGIKNFSETKRLKIPAVALAVVLFAFNIVYMGGLYQRYRPISYLTGRETREGYLARVLPDFKTTTFANNNLPPEAKVLFFFTGERGYYWEREYIYGGRLGGNLIRLVKKSSDPDDMKRALKRMGVTHLFLNDALFETFVNNNFTPDELAMVGGFFNEHLERRYTANGFSVFSLQ